MKIEISPALAIEAKADLLAVVVDEDGLEENATVGALDRTLGGLLRRAMREERFRGKAGQTFTFATHDKLPAARLALLGVGKRSALKAPALRALGARAAKLAQNVGASRLAVAPALELFGTDAGTATELLAAGIGLGCYRFDKYLADDKRTPLALQHADLLIGHPASDLTGAASRGLRVAAAVARTRDLVNEPAGELTPTRLAEIAGGLAAEYGLTAKVLGPEECRREGMNLFLAVAQGSTEEPRFIHLAYTPPGARKRVALIGKGVTFDSGGLSLKPNDSMLDMKTDMAGAATVLSAIALIASEKLPVEVHAIAACTENMPSGRSYKLGDVIRSKAGKTVEINNTDAEGRLTLADAIAYALPFAPDCLFDFATLTGACIVALGPHTAGVMSNDESLAAAWLDAARAAGEDMWRLPLPERLFEQLKSDVADMKNTGERWGGALTAGLFLKEFVAEVPWVHVDLAGPSTADKELGDVAKGGTGFGVATIFEYVRRVARG